MIRFGVLGAGRIGKVHGHTIAKSGKAKVAYVADADGKAAADLAAAVGAKVGTVEDIIKAKDVDAILICTPTDTHADLIEAAAKAGKKILCEKPISLTAERTIACLKVVEQTKALLMIGFNRRHDPNFANLEKRIRAGEIGFSHRIFLPALAAASIRSAWVSVGVQMRIASTSLALMMSSTVPTLAPTSAASAAAALPSASAT